MTPTKESMKQDIKRGRHGNTFARIRNRLSQCAMTTDTLRKVIDQVFETESLLQFAN